MYVWAEVIRQRKKHFRPGRLQRGLLTACIGVVATGRLVVTAPKLNGQYTYAGLRKLIQQLLGSPGSPVVVTTMIDLFKVAQDFPGRNGPQKPDCVRRVEQLERLCADDVGSERFHPYIQLHEFEALVIAGLPKLSEQYPGCSGPIQSLTDRLNRDYPTPEHVNDLQPPSLPDQADSSRIQQNCWRVSNCAQHRARSTPAPLPAFREVGDCFGAVRNRVRSLRMCPPPLVG